MLRNNHPRTLRCGNQLLELTSPVVMGIINTTPDSFYSASRTGDSLMNSTELASRMLEEGASILDIGGVSTRPGAEEVSIAEELDRVIPAIDAIHTLFPQAIISVDTYQSKVAEEAIQVGATMINDVSGGRLDESLLDVVASHQVAYVLMHMKGTPRDMQYQTDYQYLIGDLIKYFVAQLRVLKTKNITEVVIDPGFGFAKTMEQNYQLIDQLGVFRFLDCPVMVGLSRKSTLSKTLQRPVEDTLEATTALHMMALHNGASILRVHDVRPAMDAISVFNRIQQAKTLNNKSLSRL